MIRYFKTTTYLITFHLFLCTLTIGPLHLAQAAAVGQADLSLDAGIERNTHILKLRPEVFKDKEHLYPKASVEVILYHTSGANLFILFGREVPGKSGGGTWCGLGGSMEVVAPAEAETFEQGAIRECREESAGVYTLNSDYLQKHSHVVFNKKPDGREECVILVNAPLYAPAATLEKAVGEQEEGSTSKEKDRFMWINANDLLACIKDSNPDSPDKYKCSVRDIEGNTEVIDVRNYYYEMFRRPHLQKTLETLIKESADLGKGTTQDLPIAAGGGKKE